MISGIGTDIIEVERIGRLVEKYGAQWLDRIYSASEQGYCNAPSQANVRYQRLAARFAAKEAIAKAFGVGIGKGLNWLDIQIGHDEMGRPTVTLAESVENKFQNKRIWLSMSHIEAVASAFCVIESS